LIEYFGQLHLLPPLLLLGLDLPHLPQLLPPLHPPPQLLPLHPLLQLLPLLQQTLQLFLAMQAHKLALPPLLRRQDRRPQLILLPLLQKVPFRHHRPLPLLRRVQILQLVLALLLLGPPLLHLHLRPLPLHLPRPRKLLPLQLLPLVPPLLPLPLYLGLNLLQPGYSLLHRLQRGHPLLKLRFFLQQELLLAQEPLPLLQAHRLHLLDPHPRLLDTHLRLLVPHPQRPPVPRLFRALLLATYLALEPVLLRLLLHLR